MARFLVEAPQELEPEHDDVNGEPPGMIRSLSRMTRHHVGTLAYAAPEILKLDDDKEV